jgi:hypothetical protein
MALTTLEQNTISRGIAAAKLLLEEVKPQLDALNIIYDSVGGAKETISQPGIDEIPSLSGLTKVQLDDALYQLTAILRPALLSGYAVLAHLAARS